MRFGGVFLTVALALCGGAWASGSDWYIAQDSGAGEPTERMEAHRARALDDGHTPGLGVPPPHRELDEPWGGDPGRFFTGAFIGFLAHEGGHVVANTLQDTDFGLKRVDFGPIPFFTIEPGRKLSNREHYITAQAGFTAQHIVNEWLLMEHPDLRHENEPLLEGVATFNFWLTIGYSATGLVGYGPDERDTKGMADALGWSEESVSLMILAPTLLDYHRYKHPEDKWARDLSRLTKLAILGLALTADD